MATMKDVASLAGVSVGTVSYVLSGKAEEMRIPKETRDKVRAAADKLNYKTDIRAKKLKEQSEFIPTYTVVWNSDVNSDILERFMRGTSEYRDMSGENFEVMVYPIGSDKFSESLKNLQNGYSNGVVFIGLSKENQALADSTSFPFPAVIFGRSENHSSIVTDEQKIGEMAARHMAECGVKNCAVVRKIYKMDDMTERMEAFLNCASSLGMRCRVLDREYEYSMEGGMTAACDASELFPDTDGIYYLVDIMAVGGENYLLNLGLSDKIKIMSHGNSVFSRCSYPGITSTAFPIEKMAKAAMELLSKSKKECVTLPTELYERGSCRKEH